MIAIERHIVQSKDTTVCLLTESKGGLGGGRLLWQVASCLEKSTRKASFVVVPELDAKRDSHPQGLTAGARTSIVGHGELKNSGLVDSVLQAVREDCERAPDVNLRVLVLENATTLALSHCMESVIALLRECKPVRLLLADMIYTSQGQRVHFEMVVSLLRHSGRVRVEKQLFSMTPRGDLKPCSVKPSTVGDGLLESTSSTARRAVQEEQEVLSQRKLQSKYEKEMSGFMKLTLSDKDQERKANIVLPWQHEGNAQEQTPQKAETTGEPSITYVRDSDQDYDSDEDPDDDLDL